MLNVCVIIVVCSHHYLILELSVSTYYSVNYTLRGYVVIAPQSTRVLLDS